MDPVMAVVIGGVFTLAAMLFGVMALVVWLRHRRTPWFPGGMAAASVLVVIACMVAMPPAYHPAEQQRIDRLHQQFAPALERYRQTHGDYPPTLEAAGIATPRTEYGPLRYHPHRSKEGVIFYEISFGDYYQNGFTASFRSDRKTWYLDE